MKHHLPSLPSDYFFASSPDLLYHAQCDIVLTPHEVEMSRLCDIPKTEIIIPEDFTEVIEEKNKSELQMASIGCLLIIFICVFFYAIFN